MSDRDDLRNADFSERALAFALDGALFAAAWAATVKATAPELPIWANPKGGVAGLLWAAVFLAYQAWFSSDGRVSVGKRALGLRVADDGGEPLDLVRAIVRSLGYFFSQFFIAGFLWALFDRQGRALHDLPIGSRVVSDRPLGSGRRLAFRFAAGLMLVTFAAHWSWENIYRSRYERIMTVGYARAGLQEYVMLQKEYKRAHGRYADNSFALATVSIDPEGFLRDGVALYDRGRVAITADRNHFVMVARANDMEKTLVAVSGP
jgi:uncharacterized RDD family membrane protein YckC